MTKRQAAIVSLLLMSGVEVFGTQAEHRRAADAIISTSPLAKRMSVNVGSNTSISTVLDWVLLTTDIATGFEETKEPVEMNGHQQSREMLVTGKRLGDVLDALVAADLRYEWREISGVVVVRPRDAWRRGDGVLNARVPDIRMDGDTIDSLLDSIQSHVFPGFKRPATEPSGRRMSLVLKAGTLLDAVNEIVRADRGRWLLERSGRFCRPSPCVAILNGDGSTAGAIWSSEAFRRSSQPVF